MSRIEGQAEVVVYLSRGCYYCKMAKHLLQTKGVDFTAIEVDGDDALWDEMMKRSRRSTVPQVFIDGRPLGGFTDIRALDLDGRLDELLFPRNSPAETSGATP